jgi:diadenosine tetraphosphate (Ap4A) HIT family hydrolase
MKIYENEFIYIETEESQIPWLKIFSQKKYKEFSDCDKDTKQDILEALEIIELMMKRYYNPTKINIASFGNYVPVVHWHIMARFEDDNFFPEPMWGKQQRENSLDLPDFDRFCTVVAEHLGRLLSSQKDKDE